MIGVGLGLQQWLDGPWFIHSVTDPPLTPWKSYLSHYRVILATEEVITATLKITLTNTKVILTTEEVITTILKVMSAMTKVISTTEEVILTILKVISGITKEILTTEEDTQSTVQPVPARHRRHACIIMRTALPANTKTWPNVVSMLVQRRWRCANSEKALGQILAFVGLHTGVCLHPPLPHHNIIASRSGYF